MKIQPFRAIYPNVDQLPPPSTFFTTVKYEFNEYLKYGFFSETQEEGLYLCEIHTPSMVRRGLVAYVDIEEYLAGNIVKHEETMPATEEKMTELLMQRKAMIKPVLLTYEPFPEFDQIAEEADKAEPLFAINFEGEQQKHVYYQIRDAALIARIREVWETQLHKVYIADGHHRCSTNATLYTSLKNEQKAAGTYRYLLGAFFAHDQLIIHEYNRVVEMPREMSPTILMAALSRLCNIKFIPDAAKPKRAGEMTLYLDREWYRLRWKKKVLRKYADALVRLDADILNKEILNKILGITDVRNDTRLSYVDGLSGMEGLVEKTEKSSFRVGFCLFPLTFEEIVTVADAGQTLPPKSTWFEPRVKNGLIAVRI